MSDLIMVSLLDIELANHNDENIHNQYQVLINQNSSSLQYSRKRGAGQTHGIHSLYKSQMTPQKLGLATNTKKANLYYKIHLW